MGEPSKREVRNSPAFIDLDRRLREGRGEYTLMVGRTAVGGGGYHGGGSTYVFPGHVTMRACLGVIGRGGLKVESQSPATAFSQDYGPRLKLPFERYARVDSNRNGIAVMSEPLTVNHRALNPGSVGVILSQEGDSHYAARPCFEVAIGEEEIARITGDTLGMDLLFADMRTRLEASASVTSAA